MDLEILDLPPEQWRPYRELRLESLRTDPQAFGASYQENAERPDAWWRHRLEEAAEGRRSWLLFARAEGRLAGMIGAYAREGEDSAELISMFVTPALRGQGVAKALVATLLQRLREAGPFRQVTLAVNAEQHAACALYQACGFVPSGEQQVPMGDGCIHRELLMTRVLP